MSFELAKKLLEATGGDNFTLAAARNAIGGIEPDTPNFTEVSVGTMVGQGLLTYLNPTEGYMWNPENVQEVLGREEEEDEDDVIEAEWVPDDRIDFLDWGGNE